MDEDQKGGEPSGEPDKPESHPGAVEAASPAHVEPAPPTALARKIPDPPPPPPDDWDPYAEDDADGMLRMSFMEHLDELRSRIIRILIGGGVAFVLAFAFASPLWTFMQAPLREAITGVNGDIIAIDPLEQFQIIYIWGPLVASLFVAAPWVIYQVWAFISPGLYPRERRWAVPFILITAGLFVAGGAFAYYVAFRYALTFLLSIGADSGVKPTISIDRYFSLFVNVILGISVVFELPVVVFFLTLLRITTPGFLMRNSRYAVLVIVFLAALITPTPDVVNLTLFAVPMTLLYFLGVFASYLLVLHREKQKFPWKAFGLWLTAVVVIVLGAAAFLINYYDYQVVPRWPFVVP
jgi:sec-independent protein translocase protein TatC